MFEFHGWATVRVAETEEDYNPIGRAAEEEAIQRVRAAMKDAHDIFNSIFEVRQTSNNMIVVMVHGLRNHRHEHAIKLFKWLATEFPDSYGLLYIHDEESMKHDNEFRVWRLARGRFEELDDPFLSPCIPTVDAPYEYPTEPERSS